MEKQHNHSSLHFMSTLVGFGAGIIGTLLYATYKQKEFDRVLDKTREMASGAGDMVDDLSDNAKHLVSRVSNAVHRGVSSADKGAKNAVEGVRSTLHD